MTYQDVMVRRYANYTWRMDGTDYADIVWLDTGSAPTQAELDALWYGVEAEILQEQAANLRRAQMFTAHHYQDQLITIMRAITSGDDTGVQALLDEWDNL